MAKKLKMTRFAATTTGNGDDIGTETNEGVDRDIMMVSMSAGRTGVTGGTLPIQNQLSKEPTFLAEGVTELAVDLVLTATWEAMFKLAGSIFGGQVNRAWVFAPGQFPWRNGERIRHHQLSSTTGGNQRIVWEVLWQDA